MGLNDSAATPDQDAQNQTPAPDSTPAPSSGLSPAPGSASPAVKVDMSKAVPLSSLSSSAIPSKPINVLDPAARNAPPAVDMSKAVPLSSLSSPAPAPKLSVLQEAEAAITPEAALPALKFIDKYLVHPFDVMAAAGSKAGEQAGLAAVEHPLLSSLPTVGPALSAAMSEQESPAQIAAFEKSHPIAAGIGKGVGSIIGGTITDPRNWPFLLEGGAGNLKRGLSVIDRLISGGFSVMQIKSAAAEIPQIAEDIRQGNLEAASEDMTKAFGSAAAGALAGTAAVNGVPQVIGRKVSDVTKTVTEPISKGIETVRERYNPSSLTENIRRASPPSKGYAAEYAKTLEAAKPQLLDIFQNNKNISSPQDVVSAIQERTDQIEAKLQKTARNLEDMQTNKPTEQGVLNGSAKTVGDAVDTFFNEHRGAFTDEQIQAAKDMIDNRLMPKGREPSLFEAENLRRQLNKETDAAFSSEATVPSATLEAKIVANGALRNIIDQKYTELGIPNVKEWRAQEASLVDVKRQLIKGFANAEKMGDWNFIHSVIHNLTAGALGIVIGGLGGRLEGLGTGALFEGAKVAQDFSRDLEMNPNRAARRAVRIAQQTPGPTGAIIPGEPPAAGPVSPAPAGGAAPTEPPTVNDGVFSEPSESAPAAAPAPGTIQASPESFIKKVSSPESHVSSDVVNNYRAQIRAGQPIEPLKITVDDKGNVLDADGRHRALAAMQEGVPQVPVEVTRRISEAPNAKPSPKQAVEAAGGIYRGMNKDGLVEITLPRSMTDKLPIADRFKDFVSVTMPKDEVTKESVKAAMDKKFAAFGGKL